MPLTRPSDHNLLEKQVRAIINKNYPEIGSRGMVHVEIKGTPGGQVLTDREGGLSEGKELFIWGVSLWGGAKVVS